MIFCWQFFTVESGVEGAIGEVVVDEQLLVECVVVGAEASDIGVARAADGGSLSLERAASASAPAAGAVVVAVVRLAEAADGDGGAVAGDDPVHDAGRWRWCASVAREQGTRAWLIWAGEGKEITGGV